MRLGAASIIFLAGGIACALPIDDDSAEVYHPGPEVTAPRAIHKVAPYYTPQARQAQVQGTSVLEVVVDEHGMPARVSTISPIGFGLDENARDAVSQWEFKPGRKDGKPVATVTTVTVQFRLFRRVFDPAAEQRRTNYNLVVEQIQTHHRTEETLETIKNLAQQKYPPAMYLYAKMLEAGDGFPRDPELGLRLILEAAGKYYAAAMYDQGRMLLEGRRLEKDPERGLELVRNAAVLHHRAAQFFLASEYEQGGLLPQNPDQARQYFRLCAMQGEMLCQVRLAKLLLEKPDREERDYLQAIAWLELAAERGDVQARLMLDPERPVLTESQIEWVGRLKAQIAELQMAAKR
jgi:TonB family protein